MAGDMKDLEKYLAKADEIGDIIKELANPETITDSTIAKADTILKKYATEEEKKEDKNTGVNRSVINQKAFDELGKPAAPPVVDDGEAMLKAIEIDCKQRAEKRKKRMKIADELKEKGNGEFKAGNYEKAVEYYKEGLDNIKDHLALWTNLAQTHIKLEKYEEAINDCEWALRVFENSVKAYVHKGRAHLHLKQYDEALECYQKAIQCEPKKAAVIQEYMAEVELHRQKDEHSQAAEEFLKEGSIEAKGIVEVMKKIHEEKQLPLFYSGGLRIVAQALTSTNEQTLFRSSGGLVLCKQHHLIAKCFAASPRSLSREELDMCTATVAAWAAACENNDENMVELLENENLPAQLCRFLSTDSKLALTLKRDILNLLYIISQSERGRSKILATFDMSSLLSTVFKLMKKKSTVAVTSSGLVNNLALDKKLKASLRGQIEEEILPAFEALMVEEKGNPSALPASISTITNLTGDTAIRKKVINRELTWKACHTALCQHASSVASKPASREIVFSTLGLLTNMCHENSPNLQSFAPKLCETCMAIVAEKQSSLEPRVFGLLGRFTPVCAKASQVLTEAGAVDLLLERLKTPKPQDDLTRACMKCLTGCTSNHPQSRDKIMQYAVQKTGMKIVADLLRVRDESVVGNAALCIGHCVEGRQDVCAKFTATNVIQDLLVLARDSHSHDCQHNCAILCAKLVQGDARHLQRLRELHGTEILHDVLRQVSKK